MLSGPLMKARKTIKAKILELLKDKEELLKRDMRIFSITYVEIRQFNFILLLNSKLKSFSEMWKEE
jgi:hypothetical protein